MEGTNRTFTVVHNGLADFKTITEAIQQCVDGDTIKVQIGQYDEKVVLDKAINVVGDTESNGDVLITGGGISLAGGCLKNLSVQGCVEVRSGDIKIEECDISQGADGVRVHKDANPTILRNSIHDAQQGGDGIYVGDGGRGLIEENEIYNNRMNGVHVNNGDAVIRRNKVHDSPYGVFLRRGGRGTVENNEVTNIESFGIYIISGSDPVVSGNTVSNCGIHVMMIAQEGKGTVKDNTMIGSVSVKRLSTPTLGLNNIQGRFDNENTAVNS
eukprot:NODE_2967_length_963_cov_37.867225_g2947_i0.p1 GENE.NODE_2967_length_963_cov_37.867225_g2947_i0~~NODE_2967_length_963_cov_37.867225_g2947_i0.p1  ORF type:complete len:291 (-),score=51.84 NODE_2967_length_963_cov_37.867225_g2947_i0:91-900(-)